MEQIVGTQKKFKIQFSFKVTREFSNHSNMFMHMTRDGYKIGEGFALSMINCTKNTGLMNTHSNIVVTQCCFGSLCYGQHSPLHSL